MKTKSFWLLALLSGVAVTQAALPAKAKAATKTNQPYRLPPVGIEIPAATRQVLEQTLHALEAATAPLAQDRLRADLSVLLKALRYALVDGVLLHRVTGRADRPARPSVFDTVVRRNYTGVL